jgi:NAD(P)-dependent dehydrogenase (short-subunit alcohol dehydrogenase family)
MTEEEEEEAFNAACELWLGRILRVGFAAYALFGVAASAFEWATRPAMAFDPGANGLSGTNVVITGGCSGIGRATADALARHGATVVVGCRKFSHMSFAQIESADDDSIEAAAAMEATWIEETRRDEVFTAAGAAASESSGSSRRSQRARDAAAREASEASEASEAVVRLDLDLASFESVAAFAAAAADRLDGRVDVLVHNAATLRACTNTTDGFEVALQTNYLAPALLSRLLSDAMLAARPPSLPPARVVHVTCAAAKPPKKRTLASVVLESPSGAPSSPRLCDANAAYAASKALLESHAFRAAKKFEGTARRAPSSRSDAAAAAESSEAPHRHRLVSLIVDPGATMTDFPFKGPEGHTPGITRRFNPAALARRVVSKFSREIFGPHGASRLFLRGVEHAAGAVAHVATAPELASVTGRRYSDVAGAFTRETGCERANAADCGWARPPGSRRPGGEDAFARAAAEERRLERERADKEAWRATYEVLRPWLPTKDEGEEGG